MCVFDSLLYGAFVDSLGHIAWTCSRLSIRSLLSISVANAPSVRTRPGNGTFPSDILTGCAHQSLHIPSRNQTRSFSVTFVSIILILPLACDANRLLTRLELARSGQAVLVIDFDQTGYSSIRPTISNVGCIACRVLEGSDVEKYIHGPQCTRFALSGFSYLIVLVCRACTCLCRHLWWRSANRENSPSIHSGVRDNGDSFGAVMSMMHTPRALETHQSKLLRRSSQPAVGMACIRLFPKFMSIRAIDRNGVGVLDWRLLMNLLQIY